MNLPQHLQHPQPLTPLTLTPTPPPQNHTPHISNKALLNVTEPLQPWGGTSNPWGSARRCNIVSQLLLVPTISSPLMVQCDSVQARRSERLSTYATSGPICTSI